VPHDTPNSHDPRHQAFCAGGDVVSVAQSGKKGGADGGAFARNFFREEYILDYNLVRVMASLELSLCPCCERPADGAVTGSDSVHL
jgi:hypothetical protein